MDKFKNWWSNYKDKLVLKKNQLKNYILEPWQEFIDWLFDTPEKK